MPLNINCKANAGPSCLHQAAPRTWFGPARCILFEQEAALIPKDPRIPKGCALCEPVLKPLGALTKPPPDFT